MLRTTVVNSSLCSSSPAAEQPGRRRNDTRATCSTTLDKLIPCPTEPTVGSAEALAARILWACGC